MEKTIKWEHSEAIQMQQIEQERVAVLAQIGALMMDLENAKKALESINDRNKSTIKQILNNRGMDQVESVRPIPGGLLVTVPDRKAEENSDDPLSRLRPV